MHIEEMCKKPKNITALREDIQTNVFLLDNVQRRGGSTGIQKCWGSFASPYFDHLLDIQWGEGGGGGVDHVPNVLRHFLPNYSEFWALTKIPHSCPKWVNTKVTSQCPKWGGGVMATFGQCPKERRFLFWMFSLSFKDIEEQSFFSSWLLD